MENTKHCKANKSKSMRTLEVILRLEPNKSEPLWLAQELVEQSTGQNNAGRASKAPVSFLSKKSQSDRQHRAPFSSAFLSPYAAGAISLLY